VGISQLRSTQTYQVAETGGHTMRGLRCGAKPSFWLGVGTAGLLIACAAAPAAAGPVVLSGNNEVPPVTTQATGIADIGIVTFKCPPATSGGTCYTVVGTVSTAGMTPTAAHVHRGKPGENGPVVVPLSARPGTNNTIWDVEPGTTVSQAVYEAWWNGQLYVNVHSAAHPGGEIRAQLIR
jgi:hypothetical protein